MAFEDLRNFIDYLESKGELVRVATEVDPRYEIGAICRMALDRRAPALFFSHVKGSSIPIVANLVASRERYAMALESTPDTLHEDWPELSLQEYRQSHRNALEYLVKLGRQEMQAALKNDFPQLASSDTKD